MSYQIQVKVTDGTPVISATSGTVPDGTFAISGHEDANYVNISVQRTDVNNSLVANATQAAGTAAFKAEVTQ